MIPRLLHQIWLGDQAKRPVAWMETWKAMNPTWEYKLWTEENMPKSLIQRHFDTAPQLSAKGDILRFQLLYEYGGICVDADSECVEPLPDELLDNESFCVWENEWIRPGLMTPAFMGSVKGCPLMKECLDIIGSYKDMSYPAVESWQYTGPLLLTKTVCKLKYQSMTIYPSYYFAPHHYTGLDYRGKGKVYAKHYWGSTPNRV